MKFNFFKISKWKVILLVFIACVSSPKPTSAINSTNSSDFSEISKDLNKNVAEKRSINAILDTISSLDLDTLQQFSQIPSPLSLSQTPSSPAYDEEDDEEDYDKDTRPLPQQGSENDQGDSPFHSNFDQYDFGQSAEKSSRPQYGKAKIPPSIKQSYYWAGDKENFDDDSDTRHFPVSPFPPRSLDLLRGFHHPSASHLQKSKATYDSEATNEESGYYDNAYYPSSTETRHNNDDNYEAFTQRTPPQVESTPFYPSYGVPTPRPLSSHSLSSLSPKELRVPPYSSGAGRKPSHSNAISRPYQQKPSSSSRTKAKSGLGSNDILPRNLQDSSSYPKNQDRFPYGLPLPPPPQIPEFDEHSDQAIPKGNKQKEAVSPRHRSLLDESPTFRGYGVNPSLYSSGQRQGHHFDQLRYGSDYPDIGGNSKGSDYPDMGGNSKGRDNQNDEGMGALSEGLSPSDPYSLLNGYGYGYTSNSFNTPSPTTENDYETQQLMSSSAALQALQEVQGISTSTNSNFLPINNAFNGVSPLYPSSTSSSSSPSSLYDGLAGYGLGLGLGSLGY